MRPNRVVIEPLPSDSLFLGGLMEDARTIIQTRNDSEERSSARRPADLGWRALPWMAQLYIVTVITAGAVAFVSFLPRTFSEPRLFVALLLWACLTSTWKVNLPIGLSSGSTLSVSYAANLIA